VRAAFERGDLCIGALDGARLVGYLWIGFSATPHVGGVWVDFNPRARYSYKSFVRPAYRGRRIVQGLYVVADDLCHRRGRRFLIHFVDADNRASLAAVLRSGSRRVGYACYLRWPGVFAAWRSPGAARYGFRFCRPQPEWRADAVKPLIYQDSSRPQAGGL